MVWTFKKQALRQVLWDGGVLQIFPDSVFGSNSEVARR